MQRLARAAGRLSHNSRLRWPVLFQKFTSWLHKKGETIRFWDLRILKARGVWQGTESRFGERQAPLVSSIAFDSDGKLLAIGVLGNVVFLNLNAEKCWRRAHSCGRIQTMARALTYGSNGQELAGIAEGVKIWDSKTSKLLPKK